MPGLACAYHSCQGEPAGVVDVLTPDGRRLKPLCREHLARFEEGLEESKVTLRRMVVKLGHLAESPEKGYLAKLKKVRILSLEDGMALMAEIQD